jgi:hypothetical protein
VPRSYANGRKAKVSPPVVHRPKKWPDREKDQWLTALCEWITDGGSLTSFCKEYPQGPAKPTWFEWINENAIIADRYAQARERSADYLAEDIVLIADEVADAGQFDAARVNAARLRVDARKWVASKLKPKVYADRIEQVTSGALTVKHEITDEERVKALALLMGKAVIDTAPNLIEAQRLLQAKTIDHEPDKP